MGRDALEILECESWSRSEQYKQETNSHFSTDPNKIVSSVTHDDYDEYPGKAVRNWKVGGTSSQEFQNILKNVNNVDEDCSECAEVTRTWGYFCC